MTTKKEMAETIVKALYNVDEIKTDVTKRRVKKLVRCQTKSELEWAYGQGLAILKQLIGTLEEDEEENLTKE